MEIQTKFSIGDVVYRATTTTTTKQHDCPDCLGSRKWSAVSPAGGEYTFSCPRCTGAYKSRGDDLSYSVAVPLVQKLTIGSVRYDSNGRWEARLPRTEYMAHETGVGSGRIYYEDDLFATHEEALAVAEIKAKQETATSPWIVERYSKTLELCDYQLNVVGFEEQKRRHEKLVDKARALHYAVDYAVEHMKEESPDRYDVKWSVEYLRKGLAKFTGEEVGGVSPDDEPADAEATP